MHKIISLNLFAQSAKMGGELGATLGQQGVNIVKFCSEFNEQSKSYQILLPLRVLLKIFDNNNFQLIIKHPTSTFLIKHFLEDNNTIKLLNIYLIALIKKDEGDIAPIESICANVLATAYLLNLTIKNE